MFLLSKFAIWLIAWPRALWRDRELLWALSRREMNQKYKGSALGIAWSVVTPLAMLTVYTFVFTGVFRARWPGADANNPLAFGLNLFTGLIVFNTFAEVMTRAPDAMHVSKNLVKKVVFPLEMITVSYAFSSIIQSLVSLVVLFVALILSENTFSIHWIGILIIWIPLLNFNIAVGWLLATLGAYSRDVGHLTAVSTNLILFMSAVFYPISALPIKIQWVAEINPIATIIAEARSILIHKNMFDANFLVLAFASSYLGCCFAYSFFKKSSKTFADFI